MAKIIITIEGGNVQSVISDTRGLEYTIIDNDLLFGPNGDMETLERDIESAREFEKTKYTNTIIGSVNTKLRKATDLLAKLKKEYAD